jgi:hypothetical protein
VFNDERLKIVIEDTTNDALRIIWLQAENVKRLKAVRIRPDKTLVRIEGRNAQGKSSVLDAIAAAMGGGKWNPELPIRKGEKKASVKLDLGSLVIERRWTASGNTILEVTLPDGSAQKSPQAILDKLTGDLTFDPLEFVRMKPKDQADILKRLAGLDFTDLDRERERLYAERTIANRNAKEAETRLGTPPPSNVPAKPVDVAELAKQNAAAMTNNAELDRWTRTVEELELRYADENSRAESRFARFEADIDRRRKELAQDQENHHATGKKQLDELHSAKTKRDLLTRIDTAGFAAAIANVETTNRMILEAAAFKERFAEMKAKNKLANDLDDSVTRIDNEKDRRLNAAKFPLPGLSVDTNGPTLNGIPFSQASSAEQLRTSVAIGLAGKPKARIMLIRDGSLLDGDGLISLHKIAEEYDAQIFVERVANFASPSAVYIEDGEVVNGLDEQDGSQTTESDKR